MKVRDLIEHLQRCSPDDVVTVDVDDEFVDVLDVEPSDPHGMVSLQIPAALIRDHAFVGTIEDFCTYPVDNWHPDDQSEATQATSEACGRHRREHTK